MDYTLHEWVRMASHHGSIARCAIEKQAEESGLDALAVREKMRHHLRVMQEAAQQGLDERLRSVTGLTGGQAALMMKRLQAGKCLAGNLLGKAEVYALATAECNGCMGKIVAAPTAGACGILPGAVLAMMEEKGATEEQAVDALFVAAAVGQAIATQASISGAEGGCQAEVGAASAMAAAALCHLKGGAPEQCAAAAAMALGNLLGLVCDPVAGLVEVPCIKRNVVGAVNAVSCANMALAGVDYAIPCDEVIDAMGRVGSLLSPDLRETGQGGLAATPTGVRIAQTLAEQG